MKINLSLALWKSDVVDCRHAEDISRDSMAKGFEECQGCDGGGGGGRPKSLDDPEIDVASKRS